MRRPGLAYGMVLLSVATACRCSGPEVVTDPEALALPAEVDFGQSPLSHSVLREIALANRTRFPSDVALSVTGPFSIEGDPQVRLEGGASVAVKLRFQPVALGPTTGTLTATAEGAAASALLKGEGIPECATSDSCRQTHFDVPTQRCVSAPLADGTACTSRCVTGGQCVGGVCYGQAPSCDDGDGCTIDACDETGSCLHVARTCPPVDACSIAFCDPALGACSSRPVEDGTSCGRQSCATARVCINGACVTRNRPGADVALDCRYQDLEVRDGNGCAVTRRGVVRCWGQSLALARAEAHGSSLAYRPPDTVFPDAGAVFDRVSVALWGICASGPSAGRCGTLGNIPTHASELAGARSVDAVGCVVDHAGALICFGVTPPSARTVLSAGAAEVSHGRVRLEDGGLYVLAAIDGGVLPAVGPTAVVALAPRWCVIDAQGAVWCSQYSLGTQFTRVVDGGAHSASVWRGHVCWAGAGASGCVPKDQPGAPFPLPWANVAKLTGDDKTLCALLSDGTIECLGENNQGVLGVDTFFLGRTPLADGGTIDRISMGDEATAISRGGELSIVRETQRSTLPSLRGISAVDFALGAKDLAVVEPAGSLRVFAYAPFKADGGSAYWSEKPSTQVGVAAVAGWASHALISQHLVVLRSGTAAAWWLPDGLPARSAEVALGDLRGLTFNGATACGLEPDGGVTCAQLADGGVGHVALPGPATRVASNLSRTCAAVPRDGLWCWSSENPTPVRDPSVQPWIRDVAVGHAHVCVQVGTNGVSCRGTNEYGELGHPGNHNLVDWTSVTFEEPLAELISGPNARGTCARTVRGTVYCWGGNLRGQLGVEPLYEVAAPLRLEP